MVVGVVRLDVRLFEVGSLKQKRSVIKRLLNRLRSRFPISVAETGNLDLLQRGLIGACMVAGDESLIRSVFKNLEDEIYAFGMVEIIDLDVEYINYGDEIH